MSHTNVADVIPSVLRRDRCNICHTDRFMTSGLYGQRVLLCVLYQHNCRVCVCVFTLFVSILSIIQLYFRFQGDFEVSFGSILIIFCHVKPDRRLPASGWKRASAGFHVNGLKTELAEVLIHSELIVCVPTTSHNVPQRPTFLPAGLLRLCRPKRTPSKETATLETMVHKSHRHKG